jgi:Fic family protein
VGKYISIERLIEQSKETYYDALEASSALWHQNENDYLPFIRYYLGVLLKAYGEFESRVEMLRLKMSKPERVKAVIDRTAGKITKKDILDSCPDISKVTVERALSELVKSGYLVKIGAGRTAGYARRP